MTTSFRTADQHALLAYIDRNIFTLPDDEVRDQYIHAKGVLMELCDKGFNPAGAAQVEEWYAAINKDDFGAAFKMAAHYRMTIDHEETWGTVTVKLWEDAVEWIEVDTSEDPFYGDMEKATLHAISLATEQWLDHQVFRLVTCDTAVDAEYKWLHTNE